MANRIDSGVQPTAHTAVQAMIVRAQQVADQTGKAIGVRYDLEADELSLIEITPEVAMETSFVRVAAPAGMPIAGTKAAAGGVDAADAHDAPSSEFKAAPTAA
ncbi:MAG: hypothetical protein GEU87_06240 [Alphaproteobacteria bacterium]|nr:hypothetical protein [Alphaproteobacteria bacterium]